MKKSRPIIQVLLKPIYHEALAKRAKALGITEAEAVSRLVEEGLAPFLANGSEIDQARAERQLLDLVAQMARDEVRQAAQWNEGLTFAVFERLRKEHRALYEQATRNVPAAGVHRRIARQIKTAVGAKVKKRSGRPVMARVSKGLDALIGDYTLLLPPD